MKKSAFNRDFSEVVHFEDVWTWVISRERYSKEEAFNLFTEEVEAWHRDASKCDIESITEAFVKFKGGQDDNGEFINCWWLEDNPSKGSKRVWVFSPPERIRE